MIPYVRIGHNGQPVRHTAPPDRYAGLCQCECHQRAHQWEPHPILPKAEFHYWCGPCAEHRFQPWTDTLRSLI